MGMIPVTIRPLPDEMFYSWMRRMMKVNELSEDVFVQAYAGGSERNDYISLDGRRNLVTLYKGIDMYEKLSRLFLETTTYPFEALWMSVGEQGRYINSVFIEQDALNPKLSYLSRDIRICPDCVKEDTEVYGEPYLHRSHHLNGVSVCHRHGKTLLRRKFKSGFRYDYDLNGFEETQISTNDESQRAYARYANALLNARIISDSSMAKSVLFEVLRKKGYSAKTGYESFIEELRAWKYSSLIDFDVDRFLKVKAVSMTYVSAKQIMSLLMFLYPEPEELVAKLRTDTEGIIDVICDICGTAYCTTQYSKRIGYGCPSCDSKKNIQDRFRQYISNIDDSYVPKEDFISLDAPVEMRHKTCGKDIKIRPRGFIFEGTRCLCESTVTKAVAQKNIERHKGYRLIDFTSTNAPVTIYSKSCGHTFTCNYHKFLNFPGCRQCNRLLGKTDMTARSFKGRVKALVGDEYTVLSDFAGQGTKVTIRHNICGMEQDYKPTHFISDGQRCRYCLRMNKEWNDWFKLLREYKKEYGTCSIAKRAVYKGRALGLWVERQRQYKDRLSRYQVERLDEVGFDWDPLETEWSRRYEQYKRYISETGSPYIARRRDFEGEHLGAWIQSQKLRFKEGKLSSERYNKLIRLNPEIFK